MKSSGKRPRFALHRTHECFGLDAVEGRKIGIEHHLLATEKNDDAGNAVGENDGGLGHGRQRLREGLNPTNYLQATRLASPSVQFFAPFEHGPLPTE